MRKFTHFTLEIIIFSMLAVFVFILSNTSVFAASIKLSSSAETAAKGDTLYSNKLNITLNKNEIEILKDSITLTLDGAQWNNYSDEGILAANIAYTKTSETQLEIHITPTESMLSNGCTFSVPLKCVVIKNQTEIAVDISYNTYGYTDGHVVFARCSATRAALSGSLIERKTGEEIYVYNQAKNSYNNLRITVIGEDVYRTKNSITVTLDGMTWSRLSDSGGITNNIAATTTFKKLDNKTISISLKNITDRMQYSGYTMTIPLSGTVTGTGELKAVVDFGYDDIPQSEVVFGYCKDGEISLTSSSYNEVNDAGKVDDIVITDSSTQSFWKNTKFTVTIQQAYSFYQTPQINGTGKYEGKCSAALSSSNSRQCIITLTDNVLSGETGTITLSNVIIEKSATTTPGSENITVTAAASGWEEYESTAPIAKYSADAEYTRPLRMTSNIVGANEYARIAGLTFSEKDGERSYKSGDKIVLTLDNDFYWFTDGARPNVALTGKFADACEFQFNPDNKNEAYIVITKNISSQNIGTIVINNAQATRDSSGYFETLNLTAYLESEPDTANTIQVGRYNAVIVGTLTSTSTTTTTEAATETTTENADESGNSDEVSAEAAEVKFIIGSICYYINNNELKLNAAPYIKEGYTMLPVRVLANLAGISNDNIEYADGTAVFKAGGEAILEISAGEPTFMVNSEEKELSTSAEILNGTMFLPMRDLINALGIPDESIGFDSETKTVTIHTAA